MLKKIITLVIIFLITSIDALTEDNLAPCGAIPSDNLTNNSYFDSSKNRYVFECNGKDKITYSIYPDSREIKAGYINIETTLNGDLFYPVTYGGLKFRTDLGTVKDLVGTYLEPIEYRDSAEVDITDIKFIDGVLSISYKDNFMSFEHTWCIEYTIKGKTFFFHIYSTDGNVSALGNYCGIFFDRSLGTYNPRWQILPYVVIPDVIFNNKYFYSLYIDRCKSSASDISPFTQDYDDKSIYAGDESWNWINGNNEQVPVDEVCYLTVSSKLIDVLPLPSNNPSDTRDMLNDKIVFDIFRSYNFTDIENFLSIYKDYGFKDVLTIVHFWQNHGYDDQLPDHYPPNEELGGYGKFKELVDFANNNGWLIAAHEDYVIMNWNSSYYNEKDISKQRNSQKFEIYSRMYPISPERMQYYAGIESKQLKAECNTTASFLDLNAGNNPSALKQINLDTSNQNSNSFKKAIEHTKSFFSFMRDIYKGPIIGEGGIGWGRFDTFYGGYIDGVDRTPERGRQVFITPEYELRVVKQLQVNHGMGQYDRFFDDLVYPSFNFYDLDLYRASEIAFGHAGYIQIKGTGTEPSDSTNLKFCREYYLMHQLQTRYLPRDITPVEISYFDAVEWITQDELILRGSDLESVLLKISYSNGLNIWINHRNDNYVWEPMIINELSLPIPVNGFVALKIDSEIFLACSILLNGDRVDYVYSNAYIFAENRSHEDSSIGSISTNGMAILQSNSSENYDIHLLEGNFITDNLSNKKIIQTSNRCHLNIIFDNKFEFILTAPFIFYTDKMTVTLYSLPEEWFIDNGKLPKNIEEYVMVYRIEGDEEIIDDQIKILSTGNVLTLRNIGKDIRYVVRFSG
jgi:hypothetical protein